ncbi:MAG TPA: DUF1415 domain-containing protein [Caldimonas sp.]|nr:DUF1415 domain-containing protein [Caldimonas sp.]
MTERVLAETRAWVDRAVVGLQLCPFAKAPQVKGQVRYVASDAVDADALLSDLVDELKLLAAEPPDRIETTLLVHPRVFADFEDHNDFLEIAEAALVALDLEGVIQIASFHPDYRFADSDPDDIANATNRSPHPTLHLLREESIERALATFADPDSIFEANIATMQRIGVAGWAALRRQCRDDAERDG